MTFSMLQRSATSLIFSLLPAAGICRIDPAPMSLTKVLQSKPKARKQPSVIDGTQDNDERLRRVQKLLADVEAERTRAGTKFAMRLLALTAVRPGEIAGAEWAEFEDLDGAAPLWRIPAARMKGDKDRKEEVGGDHLVPLSRQAVEVLVALHQLSGQVSMVKSLPEWLGPLSATRLAGRLYGAAALPKQAEFFSLGGDDRFRGFSIAQRQGSIVWVGSVEVRLPIVRGLTCSVIDHVIGLRNIYLAGFYDIGGAYVNGRQIEEVAHAFGTGLRLDIAWLSFVEHTILRFDVAKTINDSTPLQFWVGMQHPF